MHGDQSFLKYQNKIRGIISQRKNQKVFDGKSLDKSNDALKRGISEIFLLARAELDEKDFSRFIEWTNDQVHSQVKDAELYKKKSYSDVAGLFKKIPVVTLEKEIAWIIERINAESQKINEFYDFIINLEKTVYLGNYKEAIDDLNLFEQKNGASIWSIQLMIGLEQVANGLIEQKKYTNSLRKIFKTGLLSYLAFFISGRNEVKTNFLKFIEDVEKSISAHRGFKKNEALLTYLTYKISGVYPEIEKIDHILRIEQAHSIYDIYDTFLNIAQFLIYQNREDILLRHKYSLKKLSSLKDYRIEKILKHLNINEINECQKRDYQVFDECSNEISYNDRCIRPEGVDIWGLFNKGYNKYNTEFYDSENLFKQSYESLLSFTKFSSESAKNINQLNKHILNFNIFPSVKALSYILNPISGLNDIVLSYWNIGLNSPTFGYEDLKLDNKLELLDKYKFGNICKAIVYIKNKQYRLAYHKLIYLLDGDSEFFSNYAKHALIKMYNDEKDILGLLNILNSVDILFLKNFNSITFNKIIAGITYLDLKNIENPLDRSNITYICHLNNEDSNLLASLRLGIKDVCNYYGISKPSEIDIEMFTDKMNNFLSEICIPNNLDMCRLRSLRGSKLVVEERINICQKLRSIDKRNSDKYENELSRLNYFSTLEEGRKVLSSSRIYVDIECFKKWAMHEISDEISRYKDLAIIKPDDEVQYHELIQGLYSGDSYLNSFVPESDADLLLLNILRRCEQAFLFNSNWGLDYYLSKRIRHQSFVGRLRNELEQSQLITTKFSEDGNYQDNEQWINYLCENLPEIRDDLQKIFKNFSAAFDKKLLDLKDHRLHIKTNEKPDGMLYLNIPTNYIPILRYVLDQNDFDSIFTSIVDVLWAGLNLSLKNTKTYITTDLSNQISTLFDSLKLKIKNKIEKNTPEINDKYLKLDQTITNCNASIQAVLIEIGNWFTRTDLEAHTKYILPKEMVDLAINTASKSLKNHNIKIQSNVEVIDNSINEFRLSLSNLPVFNDIFFILLDNVQEHSCLHEPEVVSSVIFDCVNNILTIDFLNECHYKSKLRNSETVERIRQEIKSKNNLRSRQEGNSGLIKLAASSNDDNFYKIDFGYEGEKHFRVKLVYPLIHAGTVYPEKEVD